MKRARRSGVDWPFVGKLFLFFGLQTIVLPDPAALLLHGRYVPADANEILSGFVLLSLGFGLHLLARRADPDRADPDAVDSDRSDA